MEDQIKATIASANNHVLQAYNKLEELGATMPEHKNIENLRATLYTLPLNVPKVTVTFDTGEGDPVVEEVFPGQTVTKPADPTKDGCIFLGWHKQTGGGYDPENPTLEGLQNALAAGDYAAFPAGTEIPDTYDGQSNPLIVAQYLDSSNNSSYGGAEGVILVRKYVEPTTFSSTSYIYPDSTTYTYLQGTYYDKTSIALKNLISDISVPYYNGSDLQSVISKWFAMSTTEANGILGDHAEGIAWDYWKNKTGLTTPSNDANGGRILKDTAGATSQSWLRTGPVSYGSTAIYTTGQIYANPPQGTCSVLPACFIAKSSTASTQSQAITAQEYNDKNITAQAYNAKSITAHDYNTNAKGVL